MDWKNLQGAKTYIIAIATVCYALGGAISGYVDIQTAIPLILGALGLSGLRAGLHNFLASVIPKYQTPNSTPAPGSY